MVDVDPLQVEEGRVLAGGLHPPVFQQHLPDVGVLRVHHEDALVVVEPDAAGKLAHFGLEAFLFVHEDGLDVVAVQVVVAPDLVDHRLGGALHRPQEVDQVVVVLVRFDVGRPPLDAFSKLNRFLFLHQALGERTPVVLLAPRMYVLRA